MDIQWYPGHMAKAKKLIKHNISLVDIIIELLDSRVPYSSKNPDIEELAKNKHRIIVLNKYDLSDKEVSKQWKSYFENKGHKVIFINSLNGKGIDKLIGTAREIMKEKIDYLKKKGLIFVPIRAMIVGIPNVGKSTLINKCVGKSISKTENKPGITKKNQWVKLRKDFELLDTPGILWPKFEEKNIGINLAIIGSINNNILDNYSLSLKLIDLLKKYKYLNKRYEIKFNLDDNSEDILNKIGMARGFKIKGNIIDINRTSSIIIDEFREGKLGEITLETPSKNIF